MKVRLTSPASRSLRKRGRYVSVRKEIVLQHRANGGVRVSGLDLGYQLIPWGFLLYSSNRLQYRVGEQTGTAVMLMDATGTPRENNRVFPFGEPWLEFAGSNNKEKFTTYQHDNDDDTDLDYAMARYYASRSGRFMTPDPGHVGTNIGDPQSLNAYVYAGNDPINFVDPDGLEKSARRLRRRVSTLSASMWSRPSSVVAEAKEPVVMIRDYVDWRLAEENEPAKKC